LKRPGERSKLTALWWWHDDLPQTGDTIKTTTGRRYLVLETTLNRRGLPVMDCIVMSQDAPNPGTREWRWRWAKRSRR